MELCNHDQKTNGTRQYWVCIYANTRESTIPHKKKLVTDLLLWKDLGLFGVLLLLRMDYSVEICEIIDGREIRLQFIVPKNYLLELLHELHSGSSVGHLCFNKTLAKVWQILYWFGCKVYIDNSCYCCHESCNISICICVFKLNPQIKHQNKFMFEIFKI